MVINMFNEREMDNLDKDDIKQVAYYLHVLHDNIEEDDVMGTKFWEACQETWANEFAHLDWNEIKNEIEENYI